MSKIDDYMKKEPVLTRAAVGYLVRQDEVLLGVRKRSSSSLALQVVAGIGGKLEPDETDEEALWREIKEEIGVEITSYHAVGHVIYLYPHKPQWSQSVTIYIITAWQGTPKETDDTRPSWFKQSEMPTDRMWPDNLYTIPLVLAGKTITGTFLYGEDGSIEEYRLEEQGD